MAGEFRVGTSGWHYSHWRGVFYPRSMHPDEYLRYYAQHFDTVELNNSFYRLPSPGNFQTWAGMVPAEFLFSIKASRYITHMKKLTDPEEPVSRFFRSATELGPKLGPVLFQLPPRWKADRARLRSFIEALPRSRRYVFEFRDPSWLTSEIFDVLHRYGCALCVAGSPGLPPHRVLTAGFTFLRFHGGEEADDSNYSRAELIDWAKWAQEALSGGTDLYAYFNNDAQGFAVSNAMQFRELLA